VQTYTGITLEYFFSTRSKLFSNEKSPKYSPAFAEAYVPNPRAHGVCYARGFGEPYQIYHGLSFSFFRLLLSFSFSKEKERNGHLLNKKEFLKKNYKLYAKYPSVVKQR